MLRLPIPKPPKRDKKAPKPIPRQGKRGKVKTSGKRNSLIWYFENHGWQEVDGVWVAQCQVCRFDLRQDAPMGPMKSVFAHKHRASQAGPETLENGLACHWTCHEFSHRDRDFENTMTESEANMKNGHFVKFSDQQVLDLGIHLGLSHYEG